MKKTTRTGPPCTTVVEGKSTVYLIEGREFARIEGSCTQTGRVRREGRRSKRTHGPAIARLCYRSRRMSKSPIQRVHVDRYLIAEILSNRSIVDAVDQVGSSIKDIPNTEPMLAKVLGQIFEQIPAQRGSVLLAGPHTKDLEPAAFRGNSFEVNSKIATPAFREQSAILADNAANSS